MLKLRRGRVVSRETAGPDDRVTTVAVALEKGQEPRRAIAYPGLTGPVEVGDEVLVNVEARDLGLGSGGFDVVYADLTRGGAGEGQPGAHVMKLNYTPIQHAVVPVEEGLDQLPTELAGPVAVLALHGQLPGAAFALTKGAPGARVGYVQTAGGALPGALSDSVEELLARGLLADHITVAPCFGGRAEAITLEGALHAGFLERAWDAALVGPGPGILGSASTLGHGGLSALHSAHSALSLGCRVTIAPRLSSGDQRERHRGLSHHTRTVLALLLRPVEVAVPEGISSVTERALEHALAGGAGHTPVRTAVGALVEGYLASGLAASTMERSFEDDRDFFLAALAAGAAVAQKLSPCVGGAD